METEQSWSFDPLQTAQAQRFNKTLERLPRFRIRNRITPMLIQTLLRAGQLGKALKPVRHGLAIETRVLVSPDGVPVSVRIIRPQGPAKGLVLDFHGGGWVIGNAQMNDDVNIALVQACDVAVISVDYRLAVSTPLQGLLDDCLAATRCVLGGGFPEFEDLPVIMVGESAGGHLAASTLLQLKRWPALLQRVCGALLYYGVFDLTGTPSVRNAGPETLVLDGPGMLEAFRRLTPGLEDEQRRQPSLSPLYGDLDGLPPALMFAGELDPLRDDTLLMAERWGRVATVDLCLLPASPHGFIHFPTPMADKALAHSREWIVRRLSAHAAQAPAR
ncbi:MULTISPECIES: alpha/beta hydrolase [unclassified Pseudomonas]|uniref:alpha/beta hydrolase n=1 Tax=unclassified Pseudomonas TaxID=196821 RepID=UPI00313B7343